MYNTSRYPLHNTHPFKHIQVLTPFKHGYAAAIVESPLSGALRLCILQPSYGHVTVPKVGSPHAIAVPRPVSHPASHPVPYGQFS